VDSTRRSARSHAARGNWEPSARQGQKSILAAGPSISGGDPRSGSGPIATRV
jgi:hypothetical protein